MNLFSFEAIHSDSEDEQAIIVPDCEACQGRERVKQKTSHFFKKFHSAGAYFKLKISIINQKQACYCNRNADLNNKNSKNKQMSHNSFFLLIEQKTQNRVNGEN